MIVIVRTMCDDCIARFYRMTSIWSEWVLENRELEDIAVFKDSIDRWGSKFDQSDSDDESVEND